MFGGARGGGKTDGLLGEFACHAGRYGEDAIGIMVRRTRIELGETMERSKRIYGPLGAKFHETDKVWKFPNGARLRFAYLENDSDADLYQGHSYSRVYIEEAGTFPSEKPILKLMATLRSGAGVPVGIRLSGNPGGPGQGWVKARYIDPCPGGWKYQTRVFENPFTKEKITREWVFIPSRVTDNSYLGEDYIANLQMAGSPELVQAWLQGDWNVVEGAFFNWSPERHVCTPFPIPDTWLRFRSMDWGFAAPASVGWWAVASDETTVRGGFTGDAALRLPRGCLVRYREWYVASGPQQGNKLTNQELAQGIIDREKGDPRVSYGVLDPSAFAEHGGPSIAEQINSQLNKNKLAAFHEADNRRVSKSGAISGWAQMRSRMLGNEIGPMIVCFNTCIDSIRTIPALQHDRNKPEDLDTEAEDHCFAADTLVDTNTGLVKISELDPLHNLIWSANSWRSDYTVRKTRKNAEIVRVRFEDGRTIMCTPDHKFLDCSGEWRYAKDLLNVEVSCDRKFSVLPSKSLMERAITYAAGTSRQRKCAYTELYGLGTMVQSPRGCTYTIGIETNPTTPSKTSNVFPLKNISQTDMASKMVRWVRGIFTSLARPRASGMALTAVGVGTLSISSFISDRLWSGVSLPFAKNAAQTIWSARRGSNKANFAVLDVAPARCESVEGAGRADVYCLDVPGTRCFTIEGGLIVHNCADEWRYACMSRPYHKVKTLVGRKKLPKDYVSRHSYEKPADWIAS
jgi:hypothetical protein